VALAKLLCSDPEFSFSDTYVFKKAGCWCLGYDTIPSVPFGLL
jgi:hypothetical protein